MRKGSYSEELVKNVQEGLPFEVSVYNHTLSTHM